ncbi:MAG: hypothetical protein R2747_24150 [Pyrinomonadaceae bacterium]
MSASAAEIIPAKAPMKVFGIDPRFIMPILISVILLIGQLVSGILESYTQTLAAIFTAMVFEALLGRINHGKIPHLASAYISGISVGILTRSPDIYWTFALCAAISITSKYVLRVRDRHIWNPSNFGICMMLLLAPYAYSTLSIQWGNNLYAMAVIWTLGSIIIYRLKRFHIVLTYVPLFVLSAYLVTLWKGDSFATNLSPITGPMYQLFIFFMITDPKTTVRHSKFAQCAVVFLIVVAETLLRMNNNIHAPYYALFIVGPLANLVDIFWLSKKSDG